MVEQVKLLAEWCAALTEAIGVLIIMGIAVGAFCVGLYRLLTRSGTTRTFHDVREGLGRGILLGLEFLVAADIIHTVAVELTFMTVGVLVIVVLIRTFLSFTLNVELTGKWPWQEKEKSRG